MAAPNSFKDPYWASLSADTEHRLNLPSGLLASIVTKGERSNADQVSEAGAKTVFQVTPATRQLVLDKYGVDAYASPEDAAEAAGLLLKESLDRNDGDIATAVAEYHGGTDRANWGPRTRAYVGRVMAEQKQQPEGQSDLAKALSERQGVSSNAIANVYEAYKAGRMTPEEAADFESDVKSGLVMLPKGATLQGEQSRAPTEKPAPVQLPPEITDAYRTGKMSEQERADLEADIQSGLVQLSQPKEELPVFENGRIVREQPGIIPQQPEPTLGQQAYGAGEAALTTATGATTGALGMIGGTLKGLAEQILSGQFGTQQAADLVEQEAMKGAEAFTFAPRTDVGKQFVEQIGQAGAALIPATGLVGELGMLGQASRQAAPAVRAAAQPVVSAVQKAGTAVAEAPGRAAQAVKGAVTGAGREAQAAPSAGAAGVEQGTLRQARANELPVPIELTEGQRTGDFAPQKFERETAKMEVEGAPLRERFNDQNAKLMQNVDHFIDESGGTAPDARSLGESVNAALQSRSERAKNRINVLYKEAEKAGEMESPVTLDSVVKHINDSQPEAANADILEVAKRKAIQTGAAELDADGNLVAKPVSLKNAEEFRKTINNAAGDNSVNIRQAAIMKGLIDGQTEGAGGKAYRKARAARARYAKDFENIGVIDNLMSTKRGTADRAVALEDVLNKSVLAPSASLDSLKQLRRVLRTEGDLGKQAWRDVQGSVLQHIKDQMTKNVGRNERGDAIVSAKALDTAIKDLDRGGKLEFLFDKKGAEQLRTLNDVAKDVLVSAPGTINWSNTASAIAALVDLVIASSTGLPAPVASATNLLIKQIRSNKLKAKVAKTLGNTREPSAK